MGLNSIRFPYALVLLAALMLADASLTRFLVSSGMVRESNPVLRGLLRHLHLHRLLEYRHIIAGYRF